MIIIAIIFKNVVFKISKYSITDTAAGMKKNAILFVKNVPTSSTSSTLKILILLFNKIIKKTNNPSIVPGINIFGKISEIIKDKDSPPIT